MARVVAWSVEAQKEKNEEQLVGNEQLKEAKGALSCVVLLLVWLREATSRVITDREFQIPSSEALKARGCAEKLLEVISDVEYGWDVDRFSCYMLVSLNECFVKSKSLRVCRERMWEKFYQLRSSGEFVNKWTAFLEEVAKVEASPTLYQYLTDKMFEHYIHKHYPVEVPTTKGSVSHLDYHERNALRYTAGAVIVSLQKKMDRTGNEAIKMCLQDLQEEGKVEINIGGSDDWTDIIDRGGLKHISENLYMLFYSMEMELRLLLDHRQINETTSSICDAALEAIKENEHTAFYWSMISANWEVAESGTLLNMLVRHWITIRGFSHAGSFVERYKQRSRKSIQKSKGLRKTLITI